MPWQEKIQVGIYLTGYVDNKAHPSPKKKDELVGMIGAGIASNNNSLRK